MFTSCSGSQVSIPWDRPHRVPQENIEKMLQQWEPNLTPDSFT